MLDSCTSKSYSAIFRYSGKMKSKEFCHVLKQLQKPLISKFSQVTNTSKWFVLAFPEQYSSILGNEIEILYFTVPLGRQMLCFQEN